MFSPTGFCCQSWLFTSWSVQLMQRDFVCQLFHTINWWVRLLSGCHGNVLLLSTVNLSCDLVVSVVFICDDSCLSRLLLVWCWRCVTQTPSTQPGWHDSRQTWAAYSPGFVTQWRHCAYVMRPQQNSLASRAPAALEPNVIVLFRRKRTSHFRCFDVAVFLVRLSSRTGCHLYDFS